MADKKAVIPVDFMFELGKQEFAALMSQIATSNAGRRGRRKLPYGRSKSSSRQDTAVMQPLRHEGFTDQT